MCFSGIGARPKVMPAAFSAERTLVFAGSGHAKPLVAALARANSGNDLAALDSLEPLARQCDPDDPIKGNSDFSDVFEMIADQFRTQPFKEGGAEAEQRTSLNLADEMGFAFASSKNVVNRGMQCHFARQPRMARDRPLHRRRRTFQFVKTWSCRQTGPVPTTLDRLCARRGS